MEKHFSVVVTGDEVAQGKPDPAVFLKAAQRLRTDSCDLIAFEDASSVVRPAKSAGMVCVGIAQSDRASILRDAGANYVISDFRSLSYSVLQKMFV